MSVAENIAAARLGYFGHWWMSPSRLADCASGFLSKLRIAAPGISRAVRKLSGGNQQKVMISRWLLRDPRALIVDEPTRGIDVGAKAEIYSILRELADQGKGIVVISSDLPEVLAIADRILVMRQGRISGELLRAAATEEKIMRLATMRVEDRQ